METKDFLQELNINLSHLYAFSRQINELDFAASLNGEFRGMQDVGWLTTITAHEVFRELKSYSQPGKSLSKAELRIVLMLYCQLAEAGGVYETLKNIMGVVTLKPYLLWPFKDLVRVKKETRRVIGPNANATFRDLATTAKAIGLSRLSFLLETTFRDDVRNGISHADYIIWNDGLRIRNRNGGNATRLSFDEVSLAINKAASFFELLLEYGAASVRSFAPPKTIVGRFSANPPMPWTVTFDPQKQTFGISGSSPAPVITPEYKRQTEINGRLGGKVLALYSLNKIQSEIDEHIERSGFEPNVVELDQTQFDKLVLEIDKLTLWDERQERGHTSNILLVSPWGFRWLSVASDFDSVLPKPLLELDYIDRPRTMPQENPT